MELPKGVRYRAPGRGYSGSPPLIAKDAAATISIDSSEGNNRDYVVNDRDFSGAIQPCLHGDWEQFHRLFRLNPPNVVYSGAEHSGDPKRPNITVVPNWTLGNDFGIGRQAVFGCTMGHFHPHENVIGRRVQEIYEFQSYGLLVIDHENGHPEIWVAQDGDKVVVPTGCHMTLYNQGDEQHPLATLDFADPDRNKADKKFVKQFGPILLIYYDDREVTFRLNDLYVNNPNNPSGVKLASMRAHAVDREVRVQRGTRLDIGRMLHGELTRNLDVAERFARLGLRLRRATPNTDPTQPSIDTTVDHDLYVSLPLVISAHSGSDVYRYFLRDDRRPRLSVSADPAVFIKGHDDRVKRLERALQLEDVLSSDAGTEPEVRPVADVVVEGVGEWVSTTYRPLFKGLREDGANISVYYINDSSWAGEPGWCADETLEPWETYLDKADARQRAIYENLRSKVVFVVTPDRTHSEIAAGWVRRGATRLVLVEKPFDSSLEHVDELRKAVFDSWETAVVGLDHYLSYAVPIHERFPEIIQHLGGAIAEVMFRLTEAQPIEQGRERTLEHGLTLDLLPHCLALLVFFGDVSTIDNIRVAEAAQYKPLISRKLGQEDNDISTSFVNETKSEVCFTFRDFSDNDCDVPCRATVGKGLADAKCFEAIGVNGNAIRIDFAKQPDPDPSPGYPWRRLMFLEAPDRSSLLGVRDPYEETRDLHLATGKPPVPIEVDRYKKLSSDLVQGTPFAIAGTLTFWEGHNVVRALDRIWRAVQAKKPWWTRYDLPA